VGGASLDPDEFARIVQYPSHVSWAVRQPAGRTLV